MVNSSLLDPPSRGALSGAIAWLEAVALGSIATSIGIIAVAGIGFMMLTGRFRLGRGVSVVFGCFILFGAKAIASGILGLASSGVPEVPADTHSPVDPEPPAMTAPYPSPSSLPKALPYDPYAGASVRY